MLTPVYTVLVIEDDLPLKRLIAQHLTSLNYNVLTAQSWKDAQALLELNEPDLIILDMRLPDANGLDLIKELAAGHAVIVLTAYGSINNAVRAIKEGAFEYLTKPITQEELELNVQRAMENLALKRNYSFVRDQQRAARPGVVAGTSEAMNTLMGLVNAVAQSNATVLIHGESGPAKRLSPTRSMSAARARAKTTSPSIAVRFTRTYSSPSYSATSAARLPARTP